MRTTRLHFNDMSGFKYYASDSFAYQQEYVLDDSAVEQRGESLISKIEKGAY